MRIAHVLRPAAGGMLTHVNDLLANPSNHGLVAAPANVLQAIALDVDQALVAGQSGNPLKQLRDGIRAARFARARQADIIHLHGISRLPLGLVAARTVRLPWVVTVHNMVGLPGHHPGRALLRMLLSKADAVIAVSDAVRESAPPSRKQIDVVHNGIDCDRFAELPGRAEARQALGLGTQTLIALAVARLSPEKGIDLLVPLAKTPGLRVLVAGDGPMRPHLESSGLECLGPRDDVPLLMAAADVVVVPSRSEGLGLTAIEAAAAGRPVVAVKTGGLPEVVAHGETGFLIEPENPDAIVQAVQTLLASHELQTGLGAQARNRARKLFSRHAMWEATDRVYQRILRP